MVGGVLCHSCELGCIGGSGGRFGMGLGEHWWTAGVCCMHVLGQSESHLGPVLMGAVTDHGAGCVIDWDHGAGGVAGSW